MDAMFWWVGGAVCWIAASIGFLAVSAGLAWLTIERITNWRKAFSYLYWLLAFQAFKKKHGNDAKRYLAAAISAEKRENP